ncbi:MAG: ATP-binding protein [Woeseia sp.]
MTTSPTNRATLESAFHAFNEQSAQLASSYRDLQEKVRRLTAELQASQSARHRELLEKERLGEQLARTLDALPGAVVVLDANGIISERNDNAAALLNQPLLGRPWSEIVKREFTPADNADGELQLNDGRIISMQRRRLAAEQGEILLLTDVTDSRRMAELLARHQRLSAIGEMTARLAHQIRTPLASALLYASQLAPGTAAGDTAAGRIAERLRELDRMVNDMLQFAGGARHADEDISVAKLLREVADTGRARCPDEIHIVVSVADASLRVAGNRDALKGALLNLLDNAAAACRRNGIVELGAMRDGKRLCLTVTDNGCGIPPNARAQIFEPFFTTRPQGTGLGLAVVKSVADAHDGELVVESSSAGTTIALSLPAPAAVNSINVRRVTAATREACNV